MFQRLNPLYASDAIVPILEAGPVLIFPEKGPLMNSFEVIRDALQF